MTRTISRFAALSLTTALLLLPGVAEAQLDPVDFRAEADAAIAQLREEQPDVADALEGAEGLLVCPHKTDIALVLGIESGTCVLLVGDQNHSFYKSTGISWGFSAGIASHDLVLAFNTEEALQDFIDTEGRFEIGVDAGLAVATVGASGQFDTTALASPITAFVFGETGLMADVSLSGSGYRKIDDIQILNPANLVRVIATAESGLGQLLISVNRWTDLGERGQMYRTIRDDGVEAAIALAGHRNSHGNLAAPGMTESVQIRAANAVERGDGWQVTLLTSEPLGLIGSIAENQGAEHDLAVIILNIDHNHNGSGEIYLGTEFTFDEQANRIAISSDSSPIQLTSISAEWN